MSKVKEEQPNCEGCEFFKHTHSNEHCYRYTEEPSLCKLRQPVEQSPAGEFTKEMRLLYELRPKVIEGKIVAKHIFDLCVRLDRSEASREALLSALEELAATFVGLPEGSIGGQAMKKATDAIAEEKEVKK